MYLVMTLHTATFIMLFKYVFHFLSFNTTGHNGLQRDRTHNPMVTQVHLLTKSAPIKLNVNSSSSSPFPQQDIWCTLAVVSLKQPICLCCLGLLVNNILSFQWCL